MQKFHIKKKRPSYHKPKINYHEPKPTYDTPKPPTYNSPAPSYSPPSYKPKTKYKPKPHHRVRPTQYKHKQKPSHKPRTKPNYKPHQKAEYKPKQESFNNLNQKPSFNPITKPTYASASSYYTSISPSYKPEEDGSPQGHLNSQDTIDNSLKEEPTLDSYGAPAPSYAAPTPAYGSPLPTYESTKLSYESTDSIENNPGSEQSLPTYSPPSRTVISTTDDKKAATYTADEDAITKPSGVDFFQVPNIFSLQPGFHKTVFERFTSKLQKIIIGFITKTFCFSFSYQPQL